ncbi:FAD-binding oxidoreductase [Streptomyces sp. NBC_00620]|uniref:FAD-binding oxidoreductase n=1 Tax=Streptomyces sp. NBC_00620 TaxID=2903666 RepID=UPI00224C92FF|nr:FAD-binding protein [Streptomyces sp. NBC_00620]MCX4977861.1 FAD-binding protein [Streptomyces sp. NBC_00620]
MVAPSRRLLFKRAAMIGGGSLPLLSAGSPTRAEGPDARTVVRPGDPRYPALVRGANQRWAGTPDEICVAASSDDVVRAVQDAVAAGRRIALRSGGHCYEDFVANAAVRTVIDLSRLNSVEYDPAFGAFCVGPGARLSQLYETLYKTWGVTVPGGACPSVAAGGHIVGGGYGPLSRLFGLTVDHLYGVEVAVVDQSGTARSVIATRDDSDPALSDLWWAHTGGGGGNFGVVTRYWLRSPGVPAETEPGRLLPAPPAELLVNTTNWMWGDLNREGFATLLRNYGRWYERHSGPSSPLLGLYSQLRPLHRSAGVVQLATQIDATRPRAAHQLAEFVAAVGTGVAARPLQGPVIRLPWLQATQWQGLSGGDPCRRFEIKSAYMRTGFTDQHLGSIHRHLTRTDYLNPSALLVIAGYGGRVNTVAPKDTAVPQRDSILKLQYVAYWEEPTDDTRHVNWVRDFYRDVHADTGGVPAPGPTTDGCFVNYPDKDLDDPRWNTSGLSSHALYYKDNYPRLQRAKARWDPLNVFRHAQSVRLGTV